MTFQIVANLDQEVQWAGQTLPRDVIYRISDAASLVAALAPEGAPVEVWAPGTVDARRLTRLRGWSPPPMRAGTPNNPQLVWADPAAKPVNDKRFALAVAREAKIALPGAEIITSLDELAAHLARGGAAAGANRAWVCKAPWTTAGRDRCWGDGELVTPQVAAQITKLLAHHRALVFEPWLDRIADVGVCGHVEASGRVTLDAPHGLTTTARGTFRGILLAPAEPLEIAEHDQLLTTAHTVGVALHRAGYAGPFGLDAFVYRDGEQRRFHPLCEINARYTFGHVARALAKRLGRAGHPVTELGFGRPPAGASAFVTADATDPSVPWVR